MTLYIDRLGCSILYVCVFLGFFFFFSFWFTFLCSKVDVMKVKISRLKLLSAQLRLEPYFLLYSLPFLEHGNMALLFQAMNGT